MAATHMDKAAAKRPLTIEDLAGRHTCSVDQAAKLLGIGRSTAFAAARDGSLPTLRLSHRLLVPTAKLLAMLEGDSSCGRSCGATCGSSEDTRDGD